MRPVALVSAGLLLTLTLAGCGQKGPLYLPGDEAAAERYGIPEQSDAEPERAEQPQTEQEPTGQQGQAPVAPANDEKRDS